VDFPVTPTISPRRRGELWSVLAWSLR